MFSVMVPDVVESSRQVTELGGKVLLGPESIRESGLTFANLGDPDGNRAGVFCPPGEYRSGRSHAVRVVGPAVDNTRRRWGKLRRQWGNRSNSGDKPGDFVNTIDVTSATRHTAVTKQVELPEAQQRSQVRGNPSSVEGPHGNVARPALQSGSARTAE